MRVVVISSTIFPVPLHNYGGLEAVAFHCAKGLAAKGHQVVLVAPDGSECEGCTIVPTGVAGQHDESMAYGGYPEHKEGEIVKRRAHQGYWQVLKEADVIIDHSWNKWSYVLKGEGNLKAPVLGVMHAPIKTMYSLLPPNVEKPCLVCISQDQANQCKEIHDSVGVRVCYNGIDLDFYQPMNVPRTDRFLFLARFSSIKGPDLAIEACKKAGVGLDLVGDTSITQEPEFFHKCKSMCDGKQIRMVGPASRGECVWWYSQAHCLLHPNQRFREPFGLAPVEAMACGCPVIAWDYGAMRETIGLNSVGWIVSTFDQLVDTVKAVSRLTMNDMRTRCREWVSQFSLQRNVDRYDELIHEAVEGGW